MLEHLGRVAMEMRGEAAKSRIASRLNKGDGVVADFEKGQTYGGLEEIVNAYAEEFGVKPIDLWEAALTAWKSEIDAAPNLARHVPAAAQPPAQSRRQSPARRGAKRKRATG